MHLFKMCPISLHKSTVQREHSRKQAVSVYVWLGLACIWPLDQKRYFPSHLFSFQMTPVFCSWFTHTYRLLSLKLPRTCCSVSIFQKDRTHKAGFSYQEQGGFLPYSTMVHRTDLPASPTQGGLEELLLAEFSTRQPSGCNRTLGKRIYTSQCRFTDSTTVRGNAEPRALLSRRLADLLLLFTLPSTLPVPVFFHMLICYHLIGEPSTGK